MHILILCSRLAPKNSQYANSYRVLNAVEYLSKKHGHTITLAGFHDSADDISFLEEYCSRIYPVEAGSPKRLLLLYLEDIFHGRFFERKGNFLNLSYSHELKKIISGIIASTPVDLIYVDNPSMAAYVSDLNIPKVLEVWTLARWHYEAYKNADSISRKLINYLQYRSDKNYESLYGKFDCCIALTEEEKHSLLSDNPGIKLKVIPFGTDIPGTAPDVAEDYPSIVFFGNLKDPYNQESLRFLYKEIYPSVKEAFPLLKFYIVGIHPSAEIMKMSDDPSIIVTGFVREIRPYLLQGSVVVLPIHGYGIKTRVLEAMGEGSSIVVSREGIHGLDVTDGKDVMIAVGSRDYIDKITYLLQNESARKELGENARMLMREKYSWERITGRLNDIFCSVMR